MLTDRIEERGDSVGCPVEEHGRCEQAGALVPIEERLVLRDVERVGGRHGEEVSVCELAAGPRARDGDRRLEQACVTNSRGTAVARELLLVDEEHVLDVEEDGVAHFASFRRVASCAAIAR
jgi:hypothetical protein